MDGFLGQHVLSSVVFLPGVVAIALVGSSLLASFLGAPRLPAALWWAAGFGTTLLVFALAVGGLALGFDPERMGLQMIEAIPWSESIGARLALGVDGIGLCFLLSTTGLLPLVMLASRREIETSVASWVFACLWLETSLLGTLASADLLCFAFFWALALIPLLLLLGRWGGVGRARASMRVWGTELIGLAGLLFVVLLLREESLARFGRPDLLLVSVTDPAAASLLNLTIDRADQWVLFAVLLGALLIRLPLVPLHFWLPSAQAAAPTGLSLLVATAFVQTAAIGILRFALPLFPDAATTAGPLLSWLGIAALVYGSLVALVQKELKRLIAYASVAHAGFALFGISTLNVQGLTGAVLQLLTHGLAIAGLFMLAGFLRARRGTTEVAAFGGLAKPMPVCAFFFGLMALSLMGLPLLGGFVGDLFVLLGSLETRRDLAIVALVAMVVAASYLLWVQRRIFLGPVDEPANRGLIDLDRLERGMLLVMTIPIIWIGVYPNPVLRRVEPAVLELLYQMERRSTPVPAIEEEVGRELVRLETPEPVGRGPVPAPDAKRSLARVAWGGRP